MHKNPRVAESAELPPRESHCQGLIKQRSIVGLRGSRGVHVQARNWHFWAGFIFLIARSY